MGSDVLLTDILVRFFIYLVLVITKYCAAVPVFAVIIPCRISVIYRKNKPLLQNFIDLPQPIPDPQVYLCCIALPELNRKFPEIRQNIFTAEVPFNFNETLLFIEIQIYFPEALFHPHKMNREGIEQFV